MNRLALITILLFAYGANAQSITREDITDYVSGPRQLVANVAVKVDKFDEAAKKGNIDSIKRELRNLQSETTAMKAIVIGLRPLHNETWYLPKVKAFSNKLNELVHERLAAVVNELEETGPSEDLNKEYQEIHDLLMMSFNVVRWGEKQLIAKFLYASIADGFCHASTLLVEDALKDFSGLKRGPIAGQEDKYMVSDLPDGALDGYIYHDKSESTVAKFIMFRNDDKAAVYNAFTNMVYYILACDHEDMEISDGVIPLEQINPQYSNYPSFKYRPRDNSKLYIIEVGMKDAVVDSNTIWEVYVEYQYLKRLAEK